MCRRSTPRPSIAADPIGSLFSPQLLYSINWRISYRNFASEVDFGSLSIHFILWPARAVDFAFIYPFHTLFSCLHTIFVYWMRVAFVLFVVRPSTRRLHSVTSFIGNSEWRFEVTSNNNNKIDTKIGFFLRVFYGLDHKRHLGGANKDHQIVSRFFLSFFTRYIDVVVVVSAK